MIWWTKWDIVNDFAWDILTPCEYMHAEWMCNVKLKLKLVHSEKKINGLWRADVRMPTLLHLFNVKWHIVIFLFAIILKFHIQNICSFRDIAQNVKFTGAPKIDSYVFKYQPHPQGSILVLLLQIKQERTS